MEFVANSWDKTKKLLEIIDKSTILTVYRSHLSAFKLKTALEKRTFEGTFFFFGGKLSIRFKLNFVGKLWQMAIRYPSNTPEVFVCFLTCFPSYLMHTHKTE